MTEGTAHRTRVQRTPVVHLLVPGGGYPEWLMWCSGSRGREDAPYGNRRCPKCLALAHAAQEDGTYGKSELGRFWDESGRQEDA